MAGDLDRRLPLGVSMRHEVLVVPALGAFAFGHRVACCARHKVSHLDEGMQLALLENGSPDEPSLPTGDVWLTMGKGAIEAVSDELVGSPKRGVLAINDGQR